MMTMMCQVSSVWHCSSAVTMLRSSPARWPGLWHGILCHVIRGSWDWSQARPQSHARGLCCRSRLVTCSQGRLSGCRPVRLLLVRFTTRSEVAAVRSPGASRLRLGLSVMVRCVMPVRGMKEPLSMELIWGAAAMIRWLTEGGRPIRSSFVIVSMLSWAKLTVASDVRVVRSMSVMMMLLWDMSRLDTDNCPDTVSPQSPQPTATNSLLDTCKAKLLNLLFKILWTLTFRFSNAVMSANLQRVRFERGLWLRTSVPRPGRAGVSDRWEMRLWDMLRETRELERENEDWDRVVMLLWERSDHGTIWQSLILQGSIILYWLHCTFLYNCQFSLK